MGANFFLWFNGTVVVLLVLRIFLGAKQGRPTALKTQEPQAQGNGAEFMEKSSGSSSEKSLNCPFQFNGHAWDAFEVLGVPGGSSKEACARAFHDMKRNQSGSNDFLDMAWKALEDYFSRD